MTNVRIADLILGPQGPISGFALPKRQYLDRRQIAHATAISEITPVR